MSLLITDLTVFRALAVRQSETSAFKLETLAVNLFIEGKQWRGAFNTEPFERNYSDTPSPLGF